MEDKFKIVSVSGFCATGSSAIFDLLLEFSNTESFPYEFRLLKALKPCWLTAVSKAACVAGSLSTKNREDSQYDIFSIS